jgi:hypothetical protein
MNKSTKKMGRPKGVVPALVHVNLRMPEETLKFYKKQYPEYTGAMRDVLTRFARGHFKEL